MAARAGDAAPNAAQTTTRANARTVLMPRRFDERCMTAPGLRDARFHSTAPGGMYAQRRRQGMACRDQFVMYIDCQVNGLVSRHVPHTSLARASRDAGPAPPRANHLRHGHAPGTGQRRLSRYSEERPVPDWRHGTPRARRAA